MIQPLIQEHTANALAELYGVTMNPADILIQDTRKEFDGDFTVVIFPLTRFSEKNPQETAEEIGAYLEAHIPDIQRFSIVKGFLNLLFKDAFWLEYLANATDEWEQAEHKKTIMVEYSSPNTNKPLHLGHVRNNLLGYSVAEILKARGHKVIKANLVNDRGIHICKSMIAWLKFGNNENPETFGMKGDHLVGKYYVEFSKAIKGQVYETEELGALDREEAERRAPLMLEAQEMLQKWEAGDPETIRIWKMMNGWVYKGFEQTYKALGVDFDKMYYESQTYLLGKDIVKEGLDKKVFFRKEDGSVWIDLTEDGLDQKLVLRRDGTSVYITQDIGTVIERFKEYSLDQLIYVVGNEQEYHFKVLKLILKRFGTAWWDKLFHLSYGMVELPSGKMKSREGTVVDADDLIQEMLDTAEKQTRELGKIEGMKEEDQAELFRKIGMAALKFYILKADPKKQMMFDPKESIDFLGFTGPFIQYTYARIQSIFRKAEISNQEHSPASGIKEAMPVVLKGYPIQALEKELLILLYRSNTVLKEAEAALSPALIANYVYELAKTFNKFYHDHKVLSEPDAAVRKFRMDLSYRTAHTIQASTALLGIELPEKM